MGGELLQKRIAKAVCLPVDLAESDNVMFSISLAGVRLPNSFEPSLPWM